MVQAQKIYIKQRQTTIRGITLQHIQCTFIACILTLWASKKNPLKSSWIEGRQKKPGEIEYHERGVTNSNIVFTVYSKFGKRIMLSRSELLNIKDQRNMTIMKINFAVHPKWFTKYWDNYSMRLTHEPISWHKYW